MKDIDGQTARQDRPTAVDLFCGAGGMSEGFKMAGYDILLGIELDESAANTYERNNPNVELIRKDIRYVSDEEIKTRLKRRKVDVVIGGPPCQGFSRANTRKNRADKRNKLYLEFVRIVKMLKPNFFVIENVSGFLKAKDGRKFIIDSIKEQLPAYKIDGRVLTASDYGVPQKRKRTFVIGRRGRGEIPFPENTAAAVDSEQIAVKRILLPKNEIDKRLFYSKRLITGFEKRERKNRAKKMGFRWQFLNPEKPSYTIPARYYKDGANALVRYSENEVRMLSTRECAKIQTFPDNYVFAESRIQTYKQIGNAVPPMMAKAVAKKVLKCLNDN
jgi:DNA (cytosine-5)-methyltransferase 1